ncbi:MAG TPA: shikimate dehydrogenase [Pyrinomonadaceae bacterium]|nr:shikimate dehydrogenase [Pyrinomonadaceae bacterium]HMP64012.1 shikimate dehydrogenase [Pyrinomonadaceae bacterium]
MTKGKLCISICARSAEELIDEISRAVTLADMIEVRFDCLDPSEIGEAIDRLDHNWKLNSERLLATFRTPDQGGCRDISEKERSEFWLSGNERPFWGADLEEDIREGLFGSRWRNRIVSFHDHLGDQIEVGKVYDRLSRSGASVIKIATTANRITDAIPLWRLLERAKSDNTSLIPIAMGEPGKWTRILGLAHGAYMTYASLSEGGETAPGQLTAEDLLEVYKIKELSPKTEVYGVIAGDTSYSMSPYIQNAAFRSAGMNRVFVPLQVEDVGEFIKLMVRNDTREVNLNFRGFAVTNPHKQAIIEHLDTIDDTAQAIGAVNTVTIEGGRLFGTNTDADGFIKPLEESFGDLRDASVAVIGAGGAARACIYALKRAGAEVSILVRDLSKAKPLADEFKLECLSLSDDAIRSDFEILVNATPLGTLGALENETPMRAKGLKGVKLVYDMTYNPRESRLLREARESGCETLDGLEMLLAQGAVQFEIWTGKPPDLDAMRAAAIKKLTR